MTRDIRRLAPCKAALLITGVALTLFAPALTPRGMAAPPTFRRRPTTIVPTPSDNTTAQPPFNPGRNTTIETQDKMRQRMFPDFDLTGATTVDEFIESLYDWKKVVKLKQAGKWPKETQEPDETGENNRKYKVTTVTYKVSENPTEIVTYDPVNGFWPGALIQGKALQLGSMEEIAVPPEKRAPFKITVSLPRADNFRVITAPSRSTVASALGSLMQDPPGGMLFNRNRGGGGGARTVSIAENFSEEQTAIDLGFSAHYLTAQLKAALNTNHSKSMHTVTAAFTERAFTAQADFEGRSRRAAFFSDAFTIDDAHALVEQKRITQNNLPTYIKSVTYGRIMLFNLSSEMTEDEMRVALGAKFDAGASGGQVDAKLAQKAKSTRFEVRATEIGGPQNGISTLIPATGIENVTKVINDYLKLRAPISTMVPISYTINTLRDDQMAAMNLTTTYTVTKYNPNPIGERFRVKMWIEVAGADDGWGDNTVEMYGTLRVNGEVWWNVDREQADTMKREAGQDIEISADKARLNPKFADVNTGDFPFDRLYDGGAPFHLTLRLRDKDDASADDDMGVYDETLDLPVLAEAGNQKIITWDSGHGESTRLHVKVVSDGPI